MRISWLYGPAGMDGATSHHSLVQDSLVQAAKRIDPHRRPLRNQRLRAPKITARLIWRLSRISRPMDL
jgi:hypothetical protein